MVSADLLLGHQNVLAYKLGLSSCGIDLMLKGRALLKLISYTIQASKASYVEMRVIYDQRKNHFPRALHVPPSLACMRLYSAISYTIQASNSIQS